jgi:hypothetical protein
MEELSNATHNSCLLTIETLVLFSLGTLIINVLKHSSNMEKHAARTEDFALFVKYLN